jgi:hypothetical protein
MKDCKIVFVMLLSLVLAGWATAVEPFLYEDFEFYVPGDENTGNPGDITWNWLYGEPGNPYLSVYADNTVKYTGNQSMRLETPLRNGYVGDPCSAHWGVQIRYSDIENPVDVNAYNIATAMIKLPTSSAIKTCSLVVRDNWGSGNDIAKDTWVSVPNDGEWHKIIAPFNGDGDKCVMRRVLLYYTIDANIPQATQLWIDDIGFERVLAINDIVDVDVNGPYGCAGGTVKLSMVMTRQPCADVNFTIDPNVTLNFGAGFGNPVNIVFTNSNWNIRREVVVDINSSAFSVQKVAVTASSTDPNFIDILPSNFSIPILGKYGASYVTSPETPTATWAGSDNTGIDLCNGYLEGSFYVSEDGFAEDWVEWAPSETGAPAYADITFDFKCLKDVNTIDILHTGYEVSLYPGSFDISYSTDGINFSTPTNYEAFPGTGFIATTHLEVNVTSVRYVKMRVHCLNDNPANWFLLSEVQFNLPIDSGFFPRYTIDPATKPLGNHKDLNQTNLMNGAISYANTSTDWVFFDNASLQHYGSAILYVNYGKVKEFSNISMNYITGNATISGVTTVISTPQLVKLSFSDDGETYGAPILVTDGDGWYATGTAGKGRTDKMTFAKQTGQYVKVEIVGDGVGTLAIGEIIITNRPQMTYVIDSTTPVYGGTGAQGDIATDTYLQKLKFGDLANTHIPSIVGAYADSDWVEWAPNQGGTRPAYAIITFDLKSVIKVKNVAITYCAWPSTPPSGVRVPGGFDVAFSTDGTNFTSFQNTGAVFDDNSVKQTVFTTTFDLPQTNAQYVKLKVRCMNDDPANWLYLAEFKFNVFTGDINDDGAVNLKDLKMMSGQWLQIGEGLSADIVGNDQIVNFEDFAKFALEWLY